MGGHDDPYAVRKNVYIEALANYRDNLHLRFSINTKNFIPLVGGVVVFPAFIYFVGVHYEKRRDNFQGIDRKYWPQRGSW